MPTLREPELQKLLLDTIGKIDGDPKYLPKINDSNDFAGPFIEIGRYGYEYVARERGEEVLRILPIDTDELLYLVFCDVTYEMTHSSVFPKPRFVGTYTKEVAEKNMIQLLEQVRIGFGERRKKELGLQF